MINISFFIIAIILAFVHNGTGQDFTPSTEVNACFGRPDGFARDPNNCQNYFICANGRTTRARCPNGLLFDAANEVCWWRNKVTCFECPRTAIYSLLAAPKTCSHFYRCWQGRATIHTCPNGLVFHPERQQCTFLRGSGCDGDDAIQEGCPARDGAHPVFLRDAFNCSAYHVCFNGSPMRQECGDGLHFNPILRVCDTPDQANCQVEPRLPDFDNGSWDRVEVPEVAALPCPESGSGFVPHTESCNAYFACSDHQAYRIDCAPGLEFDHIRHVCDRANSVRCWARENPIRSSHWN